MEPQVASKSEPILKVEELCRTISGLLPDAIIITNLNSNIVMANLQAAVMFGYQSPEELIGSSILDLIAPEDHQQAKENVQKALKMGGVRDLEYTLLKKDGRRFCGELSISVAAGSNGKPKALVKVIRDITERRQRFALAAKRSPKTTLDSIAEGVISVDGHLSDECQSLRLEPAGHRRGYPYRAPYWGSAFSRGRPRS